MFRWTNSPSIQNVACSERNFSKTYSGSVGPFGKWAINQSCQYFCLCQRHLERRFKLFTGFTPKEYSRIVKFRQAIDLLKNTTEANNLLSVAVNAGYYDVSHFLKEVKTLSGGTAESFLSPTLPQEGLLTYIEK